MVNIAIVSWLLAHHLDSSLVLVADTGLVLFHAHIFGGFADGLRRADAGLSLLA